MGKATGRRVGPGYARESDAGREDEHPLAKAVSIVSFQTAALTTSGLPA
jgi:hypothetical protein